MSCPIDSHAALRRWRESETGRGITFDPIFAKDSRLPRAGDAVADGHAPPPSRPQPRPLPFRECGRSASGWPDGDVTPRDEIRFAFDPSFA